MNNRIRAKQKSGRNGPLSRILYQGAMILTHEDCQSRSLARSIRKDDVVHRLEAATTSSERD
jgi:hypothetical protein